ncbi:MAG: kinase/pyrophosphorylase, partial [Coriobacteriaceae bacterium]|nr:kinase/pyrophosphorylase [Coriobacteriaceae bacterium]
MTDGPITIHVVSDSLGETGEMVARAVASQYADDAFRIERLPKVTSVDGLRAAVRSHCGPHCIFFYTLVDEPLREEMARLCAGGVNAVDLLGPAQELLHGVTGFEPTGEAGAVRRPDQDYFDRIEAMEFSVKHDDGRNPEGLMQADVVLVGVSRTGKTPLAMYLAFKGLRVANVPLAPGTDPPPELFVIDRRRVFGLVTDLDLLLEIRRQRMREMGAVVPGYAEREHVERELEEARAVMRRIGCLVVHTEHRAVEEAAQEIVRAL